VSESAGPPPPADLERIAAATARAAAHLVTGAYGRPRPVGRKSSPTDVVTQTDLRAEELVRAQLREATPGAGILGEERGETNPGARLQWVIDPLDGTINFLYGIPLFAVSIAAARRRRDRRRRGRRRPAWRAVLGAPGRRRAL
jgi:myo-inositol-1(or 4)-monophosphatase